MLVFLIRHAHADAGDPDDARPLSERGQEQARMLGESLAGHDRPPVVVLTSPLLRARQTAEAVAQATGAELRVEPALAPGTTVDVLHDAIGAETRTVAAVCHQPDCSEIAVCVTGADPGFPPAGMTELELAR